MNRKLQKGHIESQLRWKTKELKKNFYFEIIVAPQEVATRMYKKVPLKGTLFKEGMCKRIGG